MWGMVITGFVHDVGQMNILVISDAGFGIVACRGAIWAISPERKGNVRNIKAPTLKRLTEKRECII